MNSQDLVQRLRNSGINISHEDLIGETTHYNIEIMLNESPKIIFTRKDEPKKKGWQAAFDIGMIFSRVMWTEGDAPYTTKDYLQTENLLNHLTKEMQDDEPLYPLIAATNLGLFSLELIRDFTNCFYGNLFKDPNSRR